MSRDRLAPLALAALSAATALAFDHVFSDASYLLPALVAALVPHLVGWIGRRRGWPLLATVLVSLSGLALFATWIAAGPSTTYGLPGAATPDALLTTLDRGWGILRNGVAPVRPTDGVVLLVVLAVWVAATCADAIAFGGDAPLGATVPSLVVFVIASSLSPRDLGIWTTALYVAALLTFVAVASRDLLEERRSWFRAPLSRHGTRSVLSVGVALGAVALVAGFVVAPALPGATGDPLLSYRRDGPGDGSDGYRSATNPLVDLAARLDAPSNTPRFTVESPRRLRWRQVALDRFDGRQWTLESSSRAAGDVLPGNRTGSDTVVQRFHLLGLTERWLPAGSVPLRISLTDARVLPESLTLFSADAAVSGLSYDVVSRVPPDGLSDAAIAATRAPVPADADRYLALPSDFPRSVGRTARAVVAGATNPYARAVALRDYFTDGSFTYDLGVSPRADNHAMEEFLDTRRGFCQQFAGTFAAMARAVGLPSRVVVGYNPGRYDAVSGRFEVTDADAHAWAEVWLAGVGWSAFEPTPAGDAPGAADPDLGQAAGAGGSGGTTTPSTVAPANPDPTAPDRSTPSGAARAEGRGGSGVAIDSGESGAGGVGGARVVVLALLAAVVLAFAARALLHAHRRSRRRARRHAGPPRAAVVGAWAEVVDRLDDDGFVVRPDETPREVAARGRGAIPAPGWEALDGLARTTEAALWSPDEPTEADAAGAWAHVAAVTAAMRTVTPRRTRWRRALLPRRARPPEPGSSPSTAASPSAPHPPRVVDGRDAREPVGSGQPTR